MMSTYNALVSQINYKKQLLFQKLRQESVNNALAGQTDQLAIEKLRQEIKQIKDEMKPEITQKKNVSLMGNSSNSTSFKFKQNEFEQSIIK